jgi:hypothetical protein
VPPPLATRTAMSDSARPRTRGRRYPLLRKYRSRDASVRVHPLITRRSRWARPRVGRSIRRAFVLLVTQRRLPVVLLYAGAMVRLAAARCGHHTRICGGHISWTGLARTSRDDSELVGRPGHEPGVRTDSTDRVQDKTPGHRRCGFEPRPGHAPSWAREIAARISLRLELTPPLNPAKVVPGSP